MCVCLCVCVCAFLAFATGSYWCWPCYVEAAQPLSALSVSESWQSVSLVTFYLNNKKLD